MGRLIDADKLKEHYAWWGTSSNPDWVYMKKVVDQIVDLQPTVEKHGHWEDGKRMSLDGTFYWFRECSLCGYEREDDNEEKDTKYCPNCGAKMDGGEDDAVE